MLINIRSAISMKVEDLGVLNVILLLPCATQNELNGDEAQT